MDVDLYSRGEKPFNTEQYFNFMSDWSDGMGMFETALREEIAMWGTENITDDVIRKTVHVFDRRNMYKEIGAETENRAYVNMTIVASDNLMWFDKALGMYSKVDFDDMNVGSSVKNRTVFQDTPTGDLTGTYATNVTDHEMDTKAVMGTGLEATNRQMDSVRNVIVEFVERFDVCFMRTETRI